MNAIISKIFKNRRAVPEKLISYGFSEADGKYVYQTPFCGGEMQLSVCICGDEIQADVVDLKTQEKYTLHLVESATGSFVGGIRAEYESILTRICEKCFVKQAFKSEITNLVLNYARNKYGSEAEFLWEKFDENAVLRRSDNNKWYAALLTVQKSKLGLDGGGIAEILDLRMDPEKIDDVVDNKRYFRGYHMNKKHWITIPLDGSVEINEILSRLDDSYNLAKK